MTPIRFDRPAAIFFITRRCTQRQYLLKPSRELNDYLRYVLAYSAQKYGIRIHAFCFLSDHYHLVISDPEQLAARFTQLFHSLVARVLNAIYDRRENFWSSGKTSRPELIQAGDVFDKTLYTICNPVSHHLVADPEHWPGFRSRVEDIGTTLTVDRPKFFFREDGPTSETAELIIEPPPESGTAEEFRAQLKRAVADRRDAIATEMKALRRKIFGRERVLAQSHLGHATSIEPRKAFNPQFACKNKERRYEEIEIRKIFALAYRVALKKFVGGLRDVVFPFGTLQMRQVYGARCASLP